MTTALARRGGRHGGKEDCRSSRRQQVVLCHAAVQPTHSRAEAAVALPHLLVYYGLLRAAAPAAFTVAETANLELDWWQARREQVVPGDYGVTIARVAALTYGTSADGDAMR